MFYIPSFQVDLRNGCIIDKVLTGAFLLELPYDFRSSDMGSFLIIVVKLYSYKDSDVGNIEKSNIFVIILDLGVRREIRFNQQFFILRPILKRLYIYTCETILDFTYMRLKLT